MRKEQYKFTQTALLIRTILKPASRATPYSARIIQRCPLSDAEGREVLTLCATVTCLCTAGRTYIKKAYTCCYDMWEQLAARLWSAATKATKRTIYRLLNRRFYSFCVLLNRPSSAQALTVLLQCVHFTHIFSHRSNNIQKSDTLMRDRCYSWLKTTMSYL